MNRSGPKVHPLGAGVPDSVGATTINKMCGSGLKAVMLAHDLIRAGTNNIMIAGGMESMTNAPYLLPKARGGYRMGHGQVIDHMFLDGLEDAYDKGKLMGVFASGPLVKAVAWLIFCIIAAANAWLIWGILGA